MKKTAAIYVRVSTPDQHVESQLYDLRELASQRGFEVVHEYYKRRSENRPHYAAGAG